MCSVPPIIFLIDILVVIHYNFQCIRVIIYICRLSGTQQRKTVRNEFKPIQKKWKKKLFSGFNSTLINDIQHPTKGVTTNRRETQNKQESARVIQTKKSNLQQHKRNQFNEVLSMYDRTESKHLYRTRTQLATFPNNSALFDIVFCAL